MQEKMTKLTVRARDFELINIAFIFMSGALTSARYFQQNGFSSMLIPNSKSDAILESAIIRVKS